LQGQLDELNNALKRHVDRMRRRRKSGKATLASFSHQAKKLADHAPS
jgi:molybdenum-dependent DNA-binding transcriptional regulator ModE